MKTFTAVLLATLCAGGAFAQQGNTVPKNIRAANTLENLGDAEGLTSFDNMYGIPLEAGGIIGDFYLNQEWKRTTLMLYDRDKMLEGFPVRYEIESDQFEIKSSAGIKVLNGKRVKSFVWIDSISNAPHYFVNGRDLKDEDGDPLSGFFEVLSEGSMTLVTQTQAAVRPATYNEKFDVGQRDARIVKRINFYYVEEGVIKEIPSSKKKLLALFGEHAPAVEEFMQTNKLSVKEASHLRAVFEHYNTRAGA